MRVRSSPKKDLNDIITNLRGISKNTHKLGTKQKIEQIVKTKKKRSKRLNKKGHILKRVKHKNMSSFLQFLQ